MSAIGNGIALHGGFIPYSGTFLVFSDYARNAVRMAALMKVQEHLRLHPRLHRAGRGRAHPPGRRARLEPAPDPEPRPLAPVRHHGDRGGLGRRHRAPRRADRLRPVAPERALREALPRAGRRHPARRLRALRGRRARRRRRSSPPAPKCRWRSPRRRRWPRPASPCGSSPCPARASSTGRTPPGAPPCCPRACRASPWKPGSPTSGASTWAWRARPSAWTGFGESAPAGVVYKHFGVDAEHVVAAVKSVL